MATLALHKAVDDFLEAQERRVRRGDLSPATVSQRRFALLIFTTWADSVGIDNTGVITAVAMERYEDWLRLRRRGDKPLAKESIRTYLRAIRPLLSSVKAPIGDFKPPQKPGHRQLEVLSRQEVASLEEAAVDERDRLIVRILADCGLRVAELLGLRSSDLHEDTHARRYWLRVIGKGDKERDVPVPPPTYRRLKHYATHGGPKDAPFIFMGKRRRGSGEIERLTRSGVDQLVRNLAIRAGTGRRVFPHLLRHSYATHMLSRNMNPLLLQRILGHSSLQMISQTYSHLVISDTYDAMVEALRV